MILENTVFFLIGSLLYGIDRRSEEVVPAPCVNSFKVRLGNFWFDPGMLYDWRCDITKFGSQNQKALNQYRGIWRAFEITLID